MEEREIRLYVLHLNQDNPKKCTARKIARFGLAKLYRERRKIPQGSIILSPFSKRVLSPRDRKTAERKGITVVDCSWKNAEEVFRGMKGNFRRLPFLVAANPTNFGHPYELSSVEALASSLYIIGYKEQARKLMSKFKWGLNFFVLNREPLELYSQSENYEDVEKYESLYLR